MFDDQQLKNGCQCQLRYTLLMLRWEHNIQGGCTSYINNWLMLLWILYVMQCIGLRIQACVKLINTHVVLHRRPWLALILSGSTQKTLWRLWKHLKEFYYAIKQTISVEGHWTQLRPALNLQQTLVAVFICRWLSLLLALTKLERFLCNLPNKLN